MRVVVKRVYSLKLQHCQEHGDSAMVLSAGMEGG